jgi:hypothetical protein
MKKILLSLAAVGAIAAAAAPAAAQSWDRPDNGYGYGHYQVADRGYDRSQRDENLSPDYIKSLDWRIMKQARAGQISWLEAGRLRAQERLALKLAWRRQRGDHLAPFEYGQLTRAVRTIEAGTSHYADNDGRRGYHDHDRYAYRR